MLEWSADFVNDPSDDYNLIVEVLCDDKDVGVIRNVNGVIVVKWSPQVRELEIPVDWLISLLSTASERLKNNLG